MIQLCGSWSGRQTGVQESNNAAANQSVWAPCLHCVLMVNSLVMKCRLKGKAGGRTDPILKLLHWLLSLPGFIFLRVMADLPWITTCGRGT